MDHTLSSSSVACVPISVHDWMLSTPNFSFVDSAIDLAWMLTKHLCETIESCAVELPSRLEDQISSDHVILYVKRSLAAGNVASGGGRGPTVTDVRFRCEVRGALPFLPDECGDGGGRSSRDMAPRPISVALGKLLLEIFSSGRSSSVDFRRDVASKGSLDGGEGNKPRGEEDPPPPMGKRQVVAPTSNSTSNSARELLISLGTPLSICWLVCDLLDNGNELSDDPSMRDVMDVTPVAEALWDLTQMRTNPEKFLFDRTCPRRALDDACLFDNTDSHLVGREAQTAAMTAAKEAILAHVLAGERHAERGGSVLDANFLCEAMFLSGHAGSGKTDLLNSLVRGCPEETWFVLRCKFDEQAAPHMLLAKAFDDFFGKWGPNGKKGGDNKGGTSPSRPKDPHPPTMEAFGRVCRRIFAALDDEGFWQLCDLAPNFSLMFPVQTAIGGKVEEGITSMDKVGTARKRLQNLFHVLVKSLCSVGRPVLFVLDDLQWSESFVMDSMADFVVTYVHGATGASGETGRQGFFIAGGYRDNEVREDGDLLERIDYMRRSGRANVTTLAVAELSKVDVAKLVSVKLCLPWRYTRGLAEVVHSKTRGNPFHLIQFLRSIVQNRMLSFSVKQRRWTWDCDVVDMQMISDGVAELLTTAFGRLPRALMRTVEIVSCLGHQVNESVIDALDSSAELPSLNLRDELPRAVGEGIMEQAGPLYQFTHDIVRQTVYDLIPPEDRKILHHTIGTILLGSPADEGPETYMLAVDQINAFCKGGRPTLEERGRFAKSNATAAKFAIAASSFEQAGSYVDMGIKLLEKQHWATQYSLSLDLFEMSASVSCMHGDVAKMSSCLKEILSHARSFDDALKASSLLVKLLASSSNFEEARSHCIVILSNLGEVIPEQVGLPHAVNELARMIPTLRDITRDQIKLLPPMTDRKKLNAMKFLNMLCMYAFMSKPRLLPLLSCRMVQLTMEYGFCDDSIVGLATVAASVFHFTDNIRLASNIGKVSYSLVEESPKKHILRSRLCQESLTTLKMITEPSHSVLPLYLELYKSAMLSGDVQNAVICRWHYCAATFWVAILPLCSSFKQLLLIIEEATKYQQNHVVHCAMATLNACSYLSGKECTEVKVKSLNELDEIGERAQSHYLLYQNFVYQMVIKFWMREYKDVAELSKKHAVKHPSSQMRRIMNTFMTLYKGIAYLNLARDTKQAEWKRLGEDAVTWMFKYESMSRWNFENKSKLLQAELHYLERDLESAEAAYRASIKSAHDHRLVHEEALAYELYGIFCVENRRMDTGMEQLRLALGKYKQWGAMRKAKELHHFIDLVGLSYLERLKSM